MDDHSETPSLREVMRVYPTGVTVVAGLDAGGSPFGLTVNSFTSVSLDPPLVLVCVGRRSTWHDRLTSAASFTINVLSADQEAIALRCAREPSKGRFDEIEWLPARSGDPIIPGSLACLECSTTQVLSGGDHSILLGRVERCSVNNRAALLFHRGGMSSVEG